MSSQPVAGPLTSRTDVAAQDNFTELWVEALDSHTRNFRFKDKFVSERIRTINDLLYNTNELLEATRSATALRFLRAPGDPFEIPLYKVKNCLERIAIYTEPLTTPTEALRRIIVRMLLQILDILTLSTRKYRKFLAMRESTVGLRIMSYSVLFSGRSSVTAAVRELEELSLLEISAYANAIARKRQSRIRPALETLQTVVVQDIRSWLRPPNPQPLNYEEKRRANSCQWFFDDQFEDWKARQNGVYWVHGNAGAGMSVLCSSVIDHLRADPTLILAYFYFDSGDQEKQDCRGLVSSLVFQIASSSHEGFQFVQGERQFSTLDDHPTYERLLAMLKQLSYISGRIVVVIDALNECPEFARASGLLGFLELFSLNIGDADLHLLVTSRPEPDIGNYISRFASHDLILHMVNDHKGELSRYISTHIYECQWPDVIKAKAQQILNERANGIFGWAVIWLRYLKSLPPIDIESALNELHAALGQMYGSIAHLIKLYTDNDLSTTEGARGAQLQAIHFHASSVEGRKALIDTLLERLKEDEIVRADSLRNLLNILVGSSSPRSEIKVDLPYRVIRSQMLRHLSGADDSQSQIAQRVLLDSAHFTRTVQVLIGHEGPITSVAFSSDGRYVISGSQDRTVRIWDAATGRMEMDPFTGHTDGVLSVSFSPDGRYAVSGSRDRTVRIWDTATGQAVRDPLEGHTDFVSSVAFSPDSKHVVSGSHDGTVRVWDVDVDAGSEQSMEREPFAGHSEMISVAFSLDGKHVMAGSRDSTIWIWEVATGNMARGPFTGHTGDVNCIAFAPDDKQVVSGLDDLTLQIWDSETGARVKQPFGQHGSEPSLSVAFSPDRRRIVSGSGAYRPPPYIAA